MDKNLQAFLDVIAESEGTINKGDDGYNVIVGGTLFEPYDDHPNVLVHFDNGTPSSTAAGRYQLLHKWWIAYKKQLNLPDFSPASQDAVAIQQIKEQHAFADVLMGNFDSAVEKCANIWASLPGAGYGQHENKLDDLRAAFVDFGGTLAVA